MVREGSIVDATIIDAPTSTKNASRSRDPEMHQVKKGNQWYFGMKAHVGTDISRGLVHSLKCTPANISDGTMLFKLLHGTERKIYGDSAYRSRERQAYFESLGVKWKVSRQGYRDHPLTKRDRLWNHSVSRVRAKGEHAFGVVKNLWGHTKVRYKGLLKNTAHMFTLFALANMYMARRSLLKART